MTLTNLLHTFALLPFHDTIFEPQYHGSTVRDPLAGDSDVDMVIKSRKFNFNIARNIQAILVAHARTEPMDWVAAGPVRMGGALPNLGLCIDTLQRVELRAIEPQLVWDTMRNIIRLRQTTSHYSPSSNLFPSSLSEVDEHLKNVQKMAIQLHDEKGALEAWKLRDEFRQAAQHTFKDLEALGTLVSLPLAGYPWKHHNKCVFRGLILGPGGADGGCSELDKRFPAGGEADTNPQLSWPRPSEHCQRDDTALPVTTSVVLSQMW